MEEYNIKISGECLVDLDDVVREIVGRFNRKHLYPSKRNNFSWVRNHGMAEMDKRGRVVVVPKQYELESYTVNDLYGRVHNLAGNDKL